MRNLVATIILSGGTMTCFCQNADSIMINKIAEEMLINGKAYENLKELTKKIGGRLSGSPQMVKAEQWGLKTMNLMGADKAWMQECMVPHWVRGGKDKAVAHWNSASKSSAGSKNLDVIALGGSVGTGQNGLQAEVLEVSSFDELEAKKDQVKGKIVFYNYKFNARLLNAFQGYGDAVKYRGDGPSRASAFGAAAVIVRSITDGTDNVPHTGLTIYNVAYPKIPAVAIGLKDADWLDAALRNQKIRVTIKTNGHFLPDTTGHNIIGELTGSEFPNQFITVGGHLDSWDAGEGAQDDGAGIVQTIEIMRAFKAIGYRPRHSIRFVLFANEENGGRGGDKYAEEGKSKNEQHIFAMESDAGGFTPRAFRFTGSATQLAKLRSWIPLFLPYGIYQIDEGGGGSDINPLNVYFQTPTVGSFPDTHRYFDYHHSRSDVFEIVNKRELVFGAINMAALIYLVDKYEL